MNEVIILDLEWNTAYSTRRGRFVNEIIEYGAVKLDENLEIVDSFQMFVKSKLSKKLRGKVKELTHITNEDIRENGQDFSKVIAAFKRWAGKESIIMTWSNSDLYVLLDNCRCFTRFETIPFLYKYMDLQKYVQDIVEFEESKQIGLLTASELFNIDSSEINLHRAVGDSELCAEILKKCYDKELIEGYVQKADIPEFYDRLCFKPYVITDINSPYIKTVNMRLNCEKCGNPLRRKNQWKYKNKHFTAVLNCKTCNEDFEGRVQVKKLYDGVSIKKSVHPVKKDETETK